MRSMEPGHWGVSDARLKCLGSIWVSLRGGERAVKSLSVVSIRRHCSCLRVFVRQGAGLDEFWKFLPTTGLCGSQKTDKEKQNPGTLAWISLPHKSPLLPSVISLSSD